MTILHQFTLGDGNNPYAELFQASDGSLWGTASSGGTANGGTVFKITTSGTSYATVHNFQDGSVANDGYLPYGGLIQSSSGFLYGTAAYGGTVGNGVIFNVTSSSYNIVYQFAAFQDGFYPGGTLMWGATNVLYGTTLGGGSSGGGDGIIFKFTTPLTYSKFYQFGLVKPNPSEPICGLTKGSDGNFYGTSTVGATASGHGTVFKITPTGTLTVMRNFGDGTVANDGSDPESAVTQGTDGNFYGMTVSGGSAGYGIFYKVAP